jgi:hypothetical protein
VLDGATLLELLQSGGEPMPGDELQAVLQVLTGSDSALQALPARVDAHSFMTEVLGYAC